MGDAHSEALVLQSLFSVGPFFLRDQCETARAPPAGEARIEGCPIQAGATQHRRLRCGRGQVGHPGPCQPPIRALRCSELTDVQATDWAATSAERNARTPGYIPPW